MTITLTLRFYRQPPKHFTVSFFTFFTYCLFIPLAGNNISHFIDGKTEPEKVRYTQ